MEENNELPLEYVIREARTKAKTSPAIFMIHGYGSNEQDLFSFAEEFSDEYTIISVRAPYELPNFGYAWYSINFDAEQNKWSDNEQAIASRDLLVKFIEKACTLFNLDTKNITLLGFSQGSILSMAVAISYPRKVRNVIALSGYLNTEIIKPTYKKENHSATNFYISHGTSDQVIPVEWARKTSYFLDKIGANYVYEEFPVGHGVSPQNFYSFRKWLQK